jgi:hypothetical protein
LYSLAVIIEPKAEERTSDWRKLFCVKFHFILTCVRHYDHYEKVIYIYIYILYTYYKYIYIHKHTRFHHVNLKGRL